MNSHFPLCRCIIKLANHDIKTPLFCNSHFPWCRRIIKLANHDIKTPLFCNSHFPWCRRIIKLANHDIKTPLFCNSHFPWCRRIIKLASPMTLRPLYFVYICESHSESQTTEHFHQKQCTVCAACAGANADAVFRLLSSWNQFPWVSCILSPLCATTCHQQHQLWTLYEDWLTSVRLQM